MSTVKIAKATPFEGKPHINLANAIGASPKKPILLRIAATGERPIVFSVKNLPNGLTLNGAIISGTVENEGNYEIIITAENAKGSHEKKITLEIGENKVLISPLLGFTTWNAFESLVSQDDVISTTDKIIELGIAEYGYSYINVDSGWQHEYGGEFDAVMPNYKFPDMKKMVDYVHSKGLKCGIYSTPMLTAWGCPREYKSIPGCTVGEPDYRFADTNGGIGTIHKEKNNALQWEAWGFDYLKYDWAPTDPVNAELMRSELIKLNRDFGFCVTVKALEGYAKYWSKYCNSYRCTEDSKANWQNLLTIYNSYFPFRKHINKGHYYDLDMLDIGKCSLSAVSKWTEDEAIVSYSLRAFLCSPIQISCVLDELTDFEKSIFCNEEIIEINQDTTLVNPGRIFKINANGYIFDVFERPLSNGTYAYAFFNLGERERKVLAVFENATEIRDAWAKEDLGKHTEYNFSMQPHTVRIFKTKERLLSV